MTSTVPSTMRAAAIDQFGGPDTIALRTVPVPEIGPDEVLIQVEWAAVGRWDPFEREGGYAEMQGTTPAFPYVLGSEGAGVVSAVGERVERFKAGDRVYAAGFLNPKGGFYADFVAVDAGLVSPIPGHLSMEQAGAMSGVGVTALRGLDDKLGLRSGESLVIVGASGGIGHVAVQLAKRIGTRVLAVASGDDGVALVERLGADMAIDGHEADVADAARRFAPDGVDAALLAAGGETAKQAAAAVREDGRIAYPTGVQPEPQPRPGARLERYDGEPDAEIIARFNRLIDAGSFEVHIARSFPLDQAADAHRALDEHYLGKLALRVR